MTLSSNNPGNLNIFIHKPATKTDKCKQDTIPFSQSVPSGWLPGPC